MSTEVLGGQQRSRAIVGIVALALTLAVFLLAIQATSIWSSRGSAHLQPAPAQMASGYITPAVNGSHIPAGCRVKFGCDRGGTTLIPRVRIGELIPHRCRVKFGCESNAGSWSH
jgi:hypothetical protein